MRQTELLMQFNLTANEANIYYTLLTSGSLNGYQLAKITGISRSNTYTSLASLVDKGCAYVSSGGSKVYCPVDIEEFCSNRISKLNKAKEELAALIPSNIATEQEYITIKGKEHIRDKIRNIIEGTDIRIYICLAKKTLDFYSAEIVSLAKKNIKIVIITDDETHIEGATVYISEEKIGQVRIISDSSKVLTGDFDGPTCLYSEKKNLVELIKDSVRNEMTLIDLKEKNRMHAEE